jgi:hypothetical protein
LLENDFLLKFVVKNNEYYYTNIKEEIMGQLFAKLTELFVQGNKSTIIKLFIVFFLIIIILPVGLNYFYENVRIEQRIHILKELLDIDKNNINDTRLEEYYNTILNSLNKSGKTLFGLTIINDAPKSLGDYFKENNIWKFISGAFWFILFFILCIFSKQDSIGTKIMILVLFAIFIFLFGIGGVKIPSFSILAINIIGFPLAQLIVTIIIVLAVNKMKNKDKDKDKNK